MFAGTWEQAVFVVEGKRESCRGVWKNRDEPIRDVLASNEAAGRSDYCRSFDFDALIRHSPFRVSCHGAS